MQRNFRSQSYKEQQAEDRRKRRLRQAILAAIALALAITGLVLWLQSMGSTTGVSVTMLPCRADQDVTIFGDNILYYDNASIHCVTPSGTIKWSFTVGYGASFSCSDKVMVAWNGTQLYIVDANGKPTYNDSLGTEIQFARAGTNYVAVVCNPKEARVLDTAPDLIIKNLDGTQKDEEMDAFADKLLLDVGFYGENDQYMWTLSMDIYGTALNSVLHTFQVDRFNTGEADLGQYLVYKVLFTNNKLLVFTTQQMYTFDYKATLDQNATQLVYGWQLIDSCDVPNRDANLLLASNAQLNGSTQSLRELRVISGSQDRRYTLPTACVGAGITTDYLYAFSSDYVYCANMGEMRLYGYPLPLPDNVYTTDFVGLTANNRAVITCGDSVYAVTLPQQ